MCRRTRSRMCTPLEEVYTAYSSSPPCNGVRSILLILTMEETSYSQNRGQGGVWHVINGKEERRRGEWAYSSSSILQWSTTPYPCDGIRVILVLLLIFYIASRTPPQSRGWGVCCVLHHKEERMSKLYNTLCVSSPPHNGVYSVLFLILYLVSRLTHPLQWWRV